MNQVCPEDFCKNDGKCVLFEESEVCRCRSRFYGLKCQKLRTLENGKSDLDLINVLCYSSVCFDQGMDIVFLVDGSVRMGRRNYPIILDWIKLMTRNINLK